MDTENTKTPKPNVLLLKTTNKLDLRIGEKLSPYQISVFIIHGKTLKAHTITINLKYPHQHGMINLNYQMDRILYQIFKVILSMFLKNIGKILINHQNKYM